MNEDSASKLEITIKPSVPDTTAVTLHRHLYVAVFYSPRHRLYLTHTGRHTDRETYRDI